MSNCSSRSNILVLLMCLLILDFGKSSIIPSKPMKLKKDNQTKAMVELEDKSQLGNYSGMRKVEDNAKCGHFPCGWAVYSKKSKKANYYLKNRCECLANEKCRYQKDDINTYTFVYYCKSEF